MTPPQPPIPPPNPPNVPGSVKNQLPPNPPQQEEKPWGPIRLRWRGKYLPAELASLIVLAALASVFVLAVFVKRTIETRSARSAANQDQSPVLSSAATPPPDLQRSGLPAPPNPQPNPKAPLTPSTSTTTTATPKGKLPSTRIADNTLPQPTPAPPHTPPVVSTFVATSPDSGGESTLSWAIGGEVEKVIISPDPGQVAPAGKVVVHPDHSTQYVLTATGPGGSTTDQILVRVNSPSAPAVDFSADSTQVKLGQTATLRWTVTGADQVSIDPAIGPVNPTGSTKIKPFGTVRYTLQARGPGGTSGRTVVVQVAGNAGPTSGQLLWSGIVAGTQLVTIDHNHADTGTLTGELPGLPCILQPLDERKVGIASPPGPANNFDRLVFRVTGKGQVTVTIRWALL